MSAALRAHVAWLVHALGLSSNPLRRRVDRIAAAVTVLLLLGGLAAIPAAVVTGAALHGDLSAKASRAAATSRQVVGTLLTPSRANVLVSQDYGRAQLDSSATVRWPTEAGGRSATVPVPENSDAGDRIRLWTDAEGHRVSAPASSGDVVFSAVFGGVLVLFIVQLVCVALIVVTQHLARLQGQRGWERQWSFLQGGGRWSQL